MMTESRNMLVVAAVVSFVHSMPTPHSQTGLVAAVGSQQDTAHSSCSSTDRRLAVVAVEGR